MGKFRLVTKQQMTQKDFNNCNNGKNRKLILQFRDNSLKNVKIIINSLK